MNHELWARRYELFTPTQILDIAADAKLFVSDTVRPPFVGAMRYLRFYRGSLSAAQVGEVFSQKASALSGGCGVTGSWLRVEIYPQMWSVRQGSGTHSSTTT